MTKVHHFKYLEKFDEEIAQANSCATDRLRIEVMIYEELRNETRLQVYNQCDIAMMMYGRT